MLATYYKNGIAKLTIHLLHLWLFLCRYPLVILCYLSSSHLTLTLRKTEEKLSYYGQVIVLINKYDSSLTSNPMPSTSSQATVAGQYSFHSELLTSSSRCKLYIRLIPLFARSLFIWKYITWLNLERKLEGLIWNLHLHQLLPPGSYLEFLFWLHSVMDFQTVRWDKPFLPQLDFWYFIVAIKTLSVIVILGCQHDYIWN